METEELIRLQDAVIRDQSLESILKLATALAKKTPGERSFPQDMARIKASFEARITELKRSEEKDQLLAEESLRDNLSELRHWLSFLRHTYAGTKASSHAADYLRGARLSVERIGYIHLERRARIIGKEELKLFSGINKTLIRAGSSIASLEQTSARTLVETSRGAYRSARRRFWRVSWRRVVRTLKRHAFLLVGGFLFASLLLGKLPGLILGKGLIAVLGSFVIWGTNRWILSPLINRRLAESRKKHLEANLGDLMQAFLFARMCRVFSSCRLYEMLENSNQQYKEAVESLTHQFQDDQ